MPPHTAQQQQQQQRQQQPPPPSPHPPHLHLHQRRQGGVADGDERSSLAQALDALLEPYAWGSAVPPTSRFNGHLDPQREGKPPGVLDLWRHAWFMATKGAYIYYIVNVFARPMT
jgi:hypothetical protein